MSGDLVGEAVQAVLIPPPAKRFAALVGVDPDRLDGKAARRTDLAGRFEPMRLAR